jgi:hypothetical protein
MTLYAVPFAKPVFDLRMTPSFGGFFYAMVKAKALIFSINFNLRMPFFSLLVPINPSNAGCVVRKFLAVSNILLVRNFSKIGNSIVVHNSIDMVYAKLCFGSVVYKPSNPMRSVSVVKYLPLPVAIFVTRCKSFLVSKFGIPAIKRPLAGKKFLRSTHPKQLTCFRGIPQKLAQKPDWWHFFSHWRYSFVKALIMGRDVSSIAALHFLPHKHVGGN